MKKIRKPIPFDVDETLIKDEPAPWQYKTHPKEEADDEFKRPIMMNYYGMRRVRWPHKRHIELLKARHAIGDTILVWSANGIAWAEEVVERLGLAHLVHYAADKPTGMFDDKDVADWAPRVWLEDK